MSDIKVTSFAGTLPEVPAPLLPKTNATIAENCTIQHAVLGSLLDGTRAPLHNWETTVVRTAFRLTDQISQTWDEYVQAYPASLGAVHETLVDSLFISHGGAVTSTYDPVTQTTVITDADKNYTNLGVPSGAKLIIPIHNTGAPTQITDVDGPSITIEDPGGAIADLLPTGGIFNVAYSILRSSTAHTRFHYLKDRQLYTTTEEDVAAGTAATALGVLRPLSAPIVAPNPPEALDPSIPAEQTLLSTTSYVYTYVNSYGEESAPSRASGAVEIHEWHVSMDLSNFRFPTGTELHDVTYINIYRAVAGTYATEYQFLKQVSPADAETGVSDTNGTTPVLDTSMGAVLQTDAHTPPPKDVSTWIQLPNNRFACAVKNELFFSETGLAHAWPREYVVTLTAPITALAVFDSTLVAFTTTGITTIQGSDPQRITITPMVNAPICHHPAAVAEGAGYVLFIADTGLYKLSPQGLEKMTAGLYTDAQWVELIDPAQSHLELHDKTAFWYQEDSTTVFKLDVTQPLVGVTQQQTPPIYNTYVHDNTVRALVATGGDTAEILIDAPGTDDRTSLQYTWRSKEFTYPTPPLFLKARVYSSGPVRFSYIVDGTRQRFASGTTQKLVHNTEAFYLPYTATGTRIQFELRGTTEVQTVLLATTSRGL